MYFDHRSYWVSKDLDDRKAYQDAFDADAESGAAAIADGAASSLFAGRWAKLLTETVVKKRLAPSGENAGDWLKEIRAAWREPIDEEQLAWHQKAKLREGAHATLLWLQLDAEVNARESRWRFQACGIGDCCLFVVRDDNMTQMFPITNSADFTARPQTIGSRKESPGAAPDQWLITSGECRTGDLLVLTSDALAAWAMRRLEEGDEPSWESFWDIPMVEFEQRVRTLREENQIRYDDTTLLLLRLMSPEAAQPSTGQGNLVDDLKSSWDNVKDKLRGWGT